MQPGCRRHELALLQRLVRNDQRQDHHAIARLALESVWLLKARAVTGPNVLVQAQERIEGRLRHPIDHGGADGSELGHFRRQGQSTAYRACRRKSQLPMKRPGADPGSAGTLAESFTPSGGRHFSRSPTGPTANAAGLMNNCGLRRDCGSGLCRREIGLSISRALPLCRSGEAATSSVTWPPLIKLASGIWPAVQARPYRDRSP